VGIDAVRARYEAELANEYGNLASRTIAMIRRYRDGEVPAVPVDTVLAGDFGGLSAEVASLMDVAEATQALELIWQRVRRLNRYVEERAPWVLARDPGATAALDETLASLAEGLRVVSVLLHPYMPVAVAKLLQALGASATDYDSAVYAADGRARVAAVADLDPLFPKQT
jgi:methionyl-tRNA synthetase